MKNQLKISIIVLMGLFVCGALRLNALEQKTEQCSTESVQDVLNAINGISWYLYVQEHKNDANYNDFVLGDSKKIIDGYNFLTQYISVLKPINDLADISYNYVSFTQTVYNFLDKSCLINNLALRKKLIKFLDSTYTRSLAIHKKITWQQANELDLKAYNLMRSLFGLQSVDQINYEWEALVLNFAYDRATEQDVVTKDAELQKIADDAKAAEQKRMEAVARAMEQESLKLSNEEEALFERSKPMTELERAQEIARCLKNGEEKCVSTLAQQNYVDYAAKVADIKDPLYVFSHMPHDFSAYAGSFKDKPGIVLPIRHKRGRNVFNIFHELGHVAQGHVTDKGVKNLFTADEVKKFVILGESAFDDSTELGRHMNALFKKYSWIHSILQLLGLSAPHEYRINMLTKDDPDMAGRLNSRYNESNADLFAAKNLFKIGDIDPILHEIKFESQDLSLDQEQMNERNKLLLTEAVKDICDMNFVGSMPGCTYIADTIVAFVYTHSHVFNFDISTFNKEYHPSGFETALYLSGFLVDKLGKEKFNQLIREWEEKGKDYDFESHPMVHHQFNTPLAQMTDEQKREHLKAQEILKPYEASLLL